MARKLTPKQQGFANDYLKTGNATLAVQNNYDLSDKNDVNTAAAMGSELLTIPKIQHYIENRAEKAAEIIYEIALNGENDNVRLNASKDILDRAGLKPVERSLNVNIEKKIISVDE